MTGSTLALGSTAIANSIPRLVLGSIAGVFVDRWDRRRTMLVADLLLGLVLLPMLLVTSVDRLWILIGAIVVESSIVQFYKPAEGALLPGLVESEDLLVYAPMVTPASLLPVLLMVLVGGPFAAITAGYMTPAVVATRACSPFG